MGLTQDLVGHIVGTSLGFLDGACVERAKWRGPAHNAAMLNSLMARSYAHEPVEAAFDDRSGPAHSG
jgi:hypothetical protein